MAWSSEMKNINVGLVVDGYEQNRIFDVSGHRDNFLERFYLLRECFQKNDMECQTSDMYMPEDISIFGINRDLGIWLLGGDTLIVLAKA